MLHAYPVTVHLTILDACFRLLFLLLIGLVFAIYDTLFLQIVQHFQHIVITVPL
jgi:hypothetical protein